MSRPLVLDTGGWLLALAGEPAYQEAVESAAPIYVPGLVLVELDYHLRRQRAAMRRVLKDLARGAYVYAPPSLDELARADEIDRKFSQLELGLVDASVAALAERLQQYRVLTTDSAFAAVRVGQKWNLALELVVPPPVRRHSR